MAESNSTAMMDITNNIIEQTIAYANLPWLAPYLQNKYAAAVFFFIIFLLFSKLVGYISARWLKKGFEKTDTKVDDLILKATYGPLSNVILFLGIIIAVYIMDVSPSISSFIINLLVSIIIFIITKVVVSILHILATDWGDHLTKLTDKYFNEQILPLIQRFVQGAIWVIGFIMILGQWGIAVGPLLAGLGIAGIAIGFAVKDSLGNIFGGVSLILDQAYKVGDKIKLEDGTTGVVHNVGLRSTRVRTYTGDLIIIPNGQLVNEQIYTFAQPTEKTRVTIEFGVEYGTDVQHVKDTVVEVLLTMDNVMSEPKPVVEFIYMNQFSLDFIAKFWVEQYGSAYGKKLEATEKIYNALNNAEIGIPFPTSTIHLAKQSKPSTPKEAAETSGLMLETMGTRRSSRKPSKKKSSNAAKKKPSKSAKKTKK